MASSKERYQKQYFQRSEVKVRNAERMAERYLTEDGQAYEHKVRRTAKSRFARGKYGATRRKKTWDIAFEDYERLIANPCTYCNKSLADETGSGLDRKDNSRGYSLDNVNPCCADCNRRRSKSMGSDEFAKQTKLNKRWKE